MNQVLQLLPGTPVPSTAGNMSMTGGVELTLLLGPQDVRKALRHPALASLKRGRARRADFHATYYDTPDHALGLAGLSLSVRREGTRWVQAVKTAGAGVAGLRRRDTIEWSLTEPHLNLEVLDASPIAKLLARDQMETLQAVFTTEFARTTLELVFAPGTSAELVADTGVLRVGRRTVPVSDIEVRTGAHEVAAAFRLALALQASLPLVLGYCSEEVLGYAPASGATEAPQKASAVDLDEALDVAGALRVIAWSCVAQMQANEAGAVAGRDPEFLHQQRVALRRLRSCLALARAPLAAAEHLDLLDELRWLQNALGPARDWDVFAIETLPPIVRAFPDAHGLPGLRVRAGQLRRTHGRAAAEVLRSPRYVRLLLTLGLALSDGTFAAKNEAAAWLAHPVQRYAADVLESRHRKLKARGTDLATATPAERHAARIAAKKLRYAAESFAPLFGRKETRRYVAALAGLQDSLGALNDAAVTGRLLVELAVAGKTPPDATAIELVRGWVAGSAHRGLGELISRWEDFAVCKRFWR